MPRPHHHTALSAVVLALAVSVVVGVVGCADLLAKAGPKTRYVVASARCVQDDPRLSTVYRDNAASIEWMQSKIRSMEQVGRRIVAGQLSFTAEQGRQYLDTLDVMKRVEYCLRVGRQGGDVGAARMEALGS